MRNRFSSLLFLLILTLAAVLPLSAQSGEQGAFVVTQNGNQLGLEHFSIQRRPGRESANVELNYVIDGNAVQQQSQLEYKNGALARYAWNQGKPYITVSYSKGSLSAHYSAGHGPGRDYQFQMPANTFILDANFYTHWELLVEHYNRKQGGIQSFRVFVPHTGDPGTVTVQALPPSPGPLAKDYHLRATTSEASVDLYLRGNQLEQLSIPAVGIVVTRQ